MDKVTYEQPLNERIRTFLRLELLFSQIEYHIQGDSSYESRVCINSILDLLNVFNRNELKTEVMKELERHSTVLSRLEQSPSVDHERLRHVLNQIEPLLETLRENTGPIANELRKNEFLNVIRQRASIPGGDCAFDLPMYHFWLHRPAAQRRKQLRDWVQEFDGMAQAVTLILQLIRESARAQSHTAQEGFYERKVDPNAPCQLIRIAVPEECRFFPEVSAGKHRFTIRFMDGEAEGRPQPAMDDIEFELTCCAI